MTDSINNYREIQQKHVILLENVGILESENSGILPMWDAYYETCNKIEVFRSQCRPHIGNVVDNSPSSSIRLKKLRFQTFDGDMRKYPKFKAEFQKYIQPLCKSDEIAFILRSYLIDEISEEVDSLGDDIHQIWKRLDKKYGHAIMSAIKQMPTCSNSDEQRVLEMINRIEKAHRDLKRLDLEKEISNSTIVSIIEERLPEDIQIEWIRIVTGDERDEISRDKFPSLLKLLLTCRERIEYKLSEIRFVSAKKGKVNHEELSKTRNEQVLENTKQRCWLHQTDGDHPIWRCRLFESKEPQEKVDLVRKNNAYFACLDIGHVAKNCKRNFKCKEEGCGLPHHQLLYEAHASGIVFHGTLPSNKLGKQIPNTILQLQRIQGGQKFGMQSPINILWDSGSTLSFITFELAKRLKLSGQKVKLEIAKVGGETNILDSRRYELCVTDKHGDTVTIEVLGIDNISTDIVEVKLDGTF